MAIRIGIVPYLNTEPLVYGLAENLPDVRAIRAVPSRLSGMLADGQLDVAIVSSIEYFRGPGYRIVGDACIASRGEVQSVRLFSRVPPTAIRTLALDAASRASTALAQIVLAQRYGVRPRLTDFAVDADPNAWPEGFDAVVLIGDRCMAVPVGTRPVELDLGREWTDWTGLPFVYAAWICRPDVELGSLPESLDRMRDRGVEHLDAIARRAAAEKGMAYETCHDYLSRAVHYRLGPAERDGLLEFYRRACQEGLAPQGRTLEFYGR